MPRVTQAGVVNGSTGSAGGIPLFTSSNIYGRATCPQVQLNKRRMAAACTRRDSRHSGRLAAVPVASHSGNQNNSVAFGFSDLGCAIHTGCGQRERSMPVEVNAKDRDL